MSTFDSIGFYNLSERLMRDSRKRNSASVMPSMLFPPISGKTRQVSGILATSGFFRF